MNDPKIFSKSEADRILKRAAELDGTEDTRSVTVDELRSIAGEAGFGPEAVERAITEARKAAVTNLHRPAVQRSGLLVVRLSTTRSIPVEVTSEQLMRTVRLFQPYREGPVHVKLDENLMMWRDRKGIGFTASSSDGITEIRVFLAKPLLRRGKWMGWVKAAADRLETMVLLVAGKDPAGPSLLPPQPKARES